jgi:hypothetical protein
MRDFVDVCHSARLDPFYLQVSRRSAGRKKKATESEETQAVDN